MFSFSSFSNNKHTVTTESDDSDDEYDRAAEEALRLFEEDTTTPVHGTTSTTCTTSITTTNATTTTTTTTSSSPWEFIKSPILVQALEISKLARTAEAKIWSGSEKDANQEAIRLYNNSISLYPEQVESYYRLGLLYLRTAYTVEHLLQVENYLRLASKMYQKYLLIPFPWSSNDICKEESSAGKLAEQRLVLVLIQQNTIQSKKESSELLAKMGYTHRLSDIILNYNISYPDSFRYTITADSSQVHINPEDIQTEGVSCIDSRSMMGSPEEADITSASTATATSTSTSTAMTTSTSSTSTSTSNSTPPCTTQFHDLTNKNDKIFFQLVDNTLPSPLLTSIQSSFAPRSPFWKIHSYGDVGFFSYLYHLDQPPRTSIEQMIRYLFTIGCKYYPEVREAKVAEWWVHSRPHSYGHQMHFDSDDEGRGGIRHPQMGSVFYVTGEVGGPTLMTNQRLEHSALANQGWLVPTKTNRYMMFDGRYLHGVVPGRGANPIHEDNPLSKRMTFMSAFWKDIKSRDRPCDGGYGSAMEYDIIKDRIWADLFPLKHVENEVEVETEGMEMKEMEETEEMKEMKKMNILTKQVEQAWGTSEPVIAQPLHVPVVWQNCNGLINPASDSLPPYEKCYQGL